MEEEGVQFRCNAEVGSNVKLNDVMREYQAIVLAGGSTIPRDLPIPGRDLKGVHFAMEFLKQQNKRLSERSVEGEDIFATGKHVVVIGGGDTGSDCVGTSNRQGAASVTQYELLPEPPRLRTTNMPWPTYPMTLKISSSHEEGANRHWAIQTTAFLGDENGHLRALQVAELDYSNMVNGRPSILEGSQREIPCELALLAMGFVHPQQEGMLNELGIERDERKNVKAGEKAFQTNISKVFAAGDMRRGQSLVVWAISEGRECARKVDEYLNGGRSTLETKDQNMIAAQQY
jgi:glutamate synthase (NADPH/NADH) small chain